MDAEGKDASIDINDIKVIKIVKKSKFWTGAGIGLLIGGVSGALIGEDTKSSSGWGVDVGAGIIAIALTLTGALFGGIVGATAGADKTIQIEGMTDSEIKETLEKLRKKARIPKYK